MILDTLDRLDKYGYLSPLMDKVMEFFRNTDLSSLEPGRIVLQGDDLFVNVNRQGAQTRNEAPIEAHREYIDIQVPISCDVPISALMASTVRSSTMALTCAINAPTKVNIKVMISSHL